MKDNVPGAGPPFVTVAALALAALLWALSLLHGGILVALSDIAALALFGRGVEATVGHLRCAALLAVGGSIVLAIGLQLGPSSAAPTLAVSGAVACLLGSHFALHPRARVLSLVLAPAFSTIVAVPSAILIGLWLALHAVLGTTGFDEPLAGGGAWYVHLCAFAVGLLAAAPWIAPARRAPA